MTTNCRVSGYRTLAEVVRLIESFEDRTLARSDWDHAAHLTVAVWYLLNYEEPAAVARTIEGIRAYNASHGIRQTATSGYHETLTLFWLAVAQRYLRDSAADRPALALVNGFVRAFGDRQLHLEYYSRERIASWQARQTWVEPDLRPLDDQRPVLASPHGRSAAGRRR